MKLSQRFRKHFLKLLSLITALFVWLYVINSARIKFEKTLKVEYILPENMVFSQKPINEVTYILEGPRAFIRTILNQEAMLKIDVTKDNSFKRGFYGLQESDYSFPPGVKVDRILPRRLPIRIEKRSLKNIPVKAEWTGELPSYLEISNVEIDPAEVEVSGPRSVITSLKEIPTKLIDKEKVMQQNMLSTELVIPDDRLESLSSINVTVSYQLRATKSNQIYGPIRPLIVGKTNLNGSKIGFVMKLWVLTERLNQWDQLKGDIQLIIKIPEHKKGKNWVTPIVSLPKGVYLREIKPERILVNAL